jgi:hypothetical protein
MAPSELQAKDLRGSRGGREILAKVRTLFCERRWLLQLLKERPHFLDFPGRPTRGQPRNVVLKQHFVA